MEPVLDAILAMATSPWIYLIAFAIAMLDGFFPPVPSETVVVGAAAIGVATGAPHPVLLALVAAAGAFAGDNLTYAMGRAAGTERFRWMRSERGRRAVEWARRGLERRGAALILIARYIPMGRIAVNLTAGATGFPRTRFVPLTGLAAVTWAAYSVTIGSLAGHWVKQNPLLGAGAGIVIAIVLGIVIDRLLEWRRRRRGDAWASAAGGGAARAASEDDEPVATAGS